MRKAWFALLMLSVIAIGLLHAFTPGQLHLYHDTFRRLSYFPITIGAILFGVRGGLFFAAMTSIAFIPHLLLFMGKAPETYLSELTEILLYLAAGAVIGVIAGKEKKLREGYRLLSEKLEKSYSRLHEETSLLIDVEEQLRASQKTAAIGALAESLVHEIKNPLASIRGAAEIVLDDYSEGNTRRKFPEIILRETNRLNSTVNEVLQFARQPGHRANVSFQPLASVVDHVTFLLKNGLEKNKISLKIRIKPEAAEFAVDGDKMAQVFMNIILNAGDAIGQQGIVDLNADIDGESLIVDICDDGPGVAKEDRDKIFDPFFTGKENGTGLGLSISRKIIESYRGRLELTGARKKGTCFRITLPKNRLDSDYYETV